MLASGTTETLVDIHVAQQGVIVVTSANARLIGRNGVQLAQYASPRQIKASAFNGVYLAIADTAAVVALNVPSLQQHTSTFVTETCVSAVILSANRFICGPGNDWDRIFYGYDLTTGIKFGQSAKYTYNGIPMRAIPGQDAFVTVTVGSSPADFNMYRFDPLLAAVDHGDSPYHGAFAVSLRFAFYGMPATHLITEQGHFLRFNSTCHYPGTNPCFMRDGELGSPASTERFVAMTEEGNGTHIFAVVSTGSTSYYDPVCTGTNCSVRRIDAVARVTSSSKALTTTLDRIEHLRFDGIAHRVVIGRQTGCTYQGCTGYSVDYAGFD